MSSSYPNPYGFPAPTTVSAGYGLSRFDIPGITAAIEQAAATLKPEDRGAVTVSLDRESAGAGLILRAPFGTQILARIVKPAASRFEWGLSARVAWVKSPDPKPVRWLADVRGLYRVLRNWNGRISASAKAVGIRAGLEVKLGR